MNTNMSFRNNLQVEVGEAFCKDDDKCVDVRLLHSLFNYDSGVAFAFLPDEAEKLGTVLKMYAEVVRKQNERMKDENRKRRK